MSSPSEAEPPTVATRHIPPLLYWGVLLTGVGVTAYVVGVICSILRLSLGLGEPWRELNLLLIWYSGAPTTIGLLLVLSDLTLGLPAQRRAARRPLVEASSVMSVTVALTAYNDEASIAEAVKDFARHPNVARVIVVDNSSTDETAARARAAGAVVCEESRRGYGWCVYRCLVEATAYDDTDHVVLCEGDRTFRAADIDKLSTFMPHAALVNGTRIVEQLRAERTQLGNFMFYGNFIGGKLLEAKHFGKGTFTDLGTTYKMARRETFAELLPRLNPAINLEFNAHLLDTALSYGVPTVECPVTFHPRVGVSKGGNRSNARAVHVGLKMLKGLSFGWRR